MGDAPTSLDRRMMDFWRQDHVQAAVREGVEVGELGAEQERLLWALRIVVR